MSSELILWLKQKLRDSQRREQKNRSNGAYDYVVLDQNDQRMLESLIGLVSEPKADDARDATLSKEWYAKQSHAESKCDADVGAGLAALSDEMLDAIRFRWITEDHSDAATRDACRRIIEQLPTRSLSGARIDIDAAMLAAQSASAGEKK